VTGVSVQEFEMSVTDELLSANLTYSGSFTKGDLPRSPARKIVILLCMDARIDPTMAFGLEPGDANILRNAGGRATDDVLRSLVISQQLLGTREVMVVHHTDCGLLTFNDQQLRRKLRDELGADASRLDFLPFSDLEQSVRDDVAIIKTCPLILPETLVRGFIYDVHTGKMSEVS
jgi:carbonic anhydrase